MFKKIILGTATVAAFTLISLGLPSATSAQFTPPLDAMDELNSQSPSGGLNSTDYINRANNAVNNANNQQDPFNQQPQQDPFGNSPPGGDFTPPPAPGGGGGFGTEGFGVPQSIANIKTLTAWGGTRVVAHRTGQILQDARQVSILATAVDDYFDDGEQGNDAIAGDGIYTNITINEDYISPEAHQVKTKLIQSLQFVETLTPMQFNQVPIASTEPLSPLPRITDLESKQDERLTYWAVNFLHDYRINPDEIDGEFYPTFLPPPPRAPNIPLPITFTPRPQVEENDADGEGDDGDLFDDDVTGTPQGNASSRYF